jgi:hypothetical protein
LREAIHAMLGSYADAAIFGGFVSKFVFVNNLIEGVTNEFSMSKGVMR